MRRKRGDQGEEEEEEEEEGPISTYTCSRLRPVRYTYTCNSSHSSLPLRASPFLPYVYNCRCSKRDMRDVQNTYTCARACLTNNQRITNRLIERVYIPSESQFNRVITGDTH